MYLSLPFEFQTLSFSIASIYNNKHHIALCKWWSLFVFWDFCQYILIVTNNLSSYYILSLIFSFIFFPVLFSFAIFQFVVLFYFLFYFPSTCWEFQVAPVVKNPPANAEDIRTEGSWVGKILWRQSQQPTPVFLPGESHGQRRLAD